MFESRLKISLVFLAAVNLALIIRLVDLQVVRAGHFRAEADRSMLRNPESLPAARGRILDRTAEVLVYDEPCWDVFVDFDVIAADAGGDGERLRRLVERFRRNRRYSNADTAETVEKELQEEWRRMWRDIALCAPTASRPDPEELRAEAQVIHERVIRIRRLVADRRGFDSPVAEERRSHAVLTGLSAERQILARERLAQYPWVAVEASSRRRHAPGGEAFAHVLGRLGRVDASHIAGDPNLDDPFGCYLPDERLGVSGVEAAAEQTLRGRRGQITFDRDGNVVDAPIDSEPGGDVTVTLHAELQRRLYLLLGDRVRAIPESSGGAMVVLDVASREVLALVSYPAFDPDDFDERFQMLREDTERSPLQFRAVAGRYAPGSIVKPLVCLAGLLNGRITPNTQVDCNGFLLPEHPDRWRCWEVRGTGTRMAHGSVDVVRALTGSCNVFLFRLGDQLGVDSLCGAFDMAGIGRTTGIGLREESLGINPTPEWLLHEKGTGVYPAHARNFAIGQGEVSVTPVQAANLAATYANGRFRHVTLIRGGATRPEWILPASASAWSAVRRGIFGVVNDPEGTAYKYAHFVHDRYALCGKTGSATAYSWPTAFRIPYRDANGVESVATIRAGARGPACRRFEAEFPGAVYDPAEVRVAETWPRDAATDSDYSHAWFAGYLQRIDGQGRPIESEAPRVAFAVLVEFGGSGGQTSGPIARDVAAMLLEVLGPELGAND